MHLSRGKRVLLRKYSSRVWKSLLKPKVKDVTFGMNVRIMHIHNVSIGEHCKIGDNVKIITEDAGSRLSIGNNVFIGDDVLIDYSGPLSIGDDCLISEGAKIYTHDHGYDPKSIPQKSPLTIGENTWIGVDAVILGKVASIGRECVISPGTVVSRNIGNRKIVIGNPCEVIGKNEFKETH